MKLSVNGVERELPDSIATLEALLANLRYTLPVFVVALNGAVVEPRDYANRPVRDGDSIEVFNQITGG